LTNEKLTGRVEEAINPLYSVLLTGDGTGVVSAITADDGDVILAEYTPPFNVNDVTYYLPLYLQTLAVLGFFPTCVTADAAFDAW
jgi:hypothetical protein